MRLVVAAVGRGRDDPAQQLFENYRHRLPWPLELREVRAGGGGDAGREREAAALLKGLPEGAHIVALDGTGKALTSEAFAARLARIRDDGVAVVAFSDRGRRRAWGPCPRACRLGSFAWADDVAASARSRDAGGAALACGQHPLRPPLPPRVSDGRAA